MRYFNIFFISDESRAMLDTKLIEVNIKEKSLIAQLQDLKQHIITKLNARFLELTKDVTKNVREKRKAIEGRKSVLDRMYLQSDYALAFMDYANQFCENDDKALLVAKRPIERQLRRLKKQDPSSGIQSESSLKLDLYFQVIFLTTKFIIAVALHIFSVTFKICSKFGKSW